MNQAVRFIGLPNRCGLMAVACWRYPSGSSVDVKYSSGKFLTFSCTNQSNLRGANTCHELTWAGLNKAKFGEGKNLPLNIWAASAPPCPSARCREPLSSWCWSAPPFFPSCSSGVFSPEEVQQKKPTPISAICFRQHKKLYLIRNQESGKRGCMEAHQHQFWLWHDPRWVCVGTSSCRSNTVLKEPGLEEEGKKPSHFKTSTHLLLKLKALFQGTPFSKLSSCQETSFIFAGLTFELATKFSKSSKRHRSSKLCWMNLSGGEHYYKTKTQQHLLQQATTATKNNTCLKPLLCWAEYLLGCFGDVASPPSDPSSLDTIPKLSLSIIKKSCYMN